MEQLYTRWGRGIDSHHVLQEYPRPLLQRESYVNLNGYWEYAFTKKFQKPEAYDGQILVPFSPESVLSGVGRQLQPDEYLWYRTKLPIDRAKLAAGNRLILYFGAVDQACLIYINGKKAARHMGGYLPFSVDITEYCRKKGMPSVGDAAAATGESSMISENELILAVRDLSDTSYHARGKQKLRRGGMFYTAQSGIWQTVWMEYVPERYVEELTAKPLLEQECVRIRIQSSAQLPVKIQIREPALYRDIQAQTVSIDSSVAEAGRPSQGGIIAEAGRLSQGSIMVEAGHPFQGGIIAEADGLSNQEIEIRLPYIKSWTCEEPYLYYFTVTMGKDTVVSYFAMRTFTIEKDAEGIPRICLNGKVQFLNGVLDQGYWPDGLYTAPSDEAFIFDITEMKKLGFNMLRKHIKIEPQRWYYHCDRLGMVVWQDMVNGGSDYKHWFVTYAATLFSRKRLKIRDNCLKLLSRAEQKGRREFIREMKETIRLLKCHPSIAVWVIFNEGWGQFSAEKMTEIARACDNSRLIDQASGWFDQEGGDMQSIHNYFFALKFSPEKERATVLSEFGGYSLRVAGHSAYEKLYGYGTHRSGESLNAAFKRRMQKVKAQIPEGLCASVYTQLSDVEEEVNGIFTYDREVRKVEP
ncbi:MAG: glycoside hydrolase family 2 [Blautia sp.]|nr:glycoside hydrolase family 2 [Lachnoclostridium sp.]MCM1211886.1 glycoside hydrolase family 2 [Blautia sp.]